MKRQTFHFIIKHFIFSTVCLYVREAFELMMRDTHDSINLYYFCTKQEIMIKKKHVHSLLISWCNLHYFFSNQDIPIKKKDVRHMLPS